MSSIQSNTEYDYNTTTLQMGFRRKFKRRTRICIPRVHINYYVLHHVVIVIYVVKLVDLYLFNDMYSRWLLRAPWGMDFHLFFAGLDLSRRCRFLNKILLDVCIKALDNVSSNWVFLLVILVNAVKLEFLCFLLSNVTQVNCKF